MNTLANPVWLNVGEHWAAWMIAMSWQVALLVAVVWVLTRLLRRTSAAFRFALWGLVLLKLAIPPDIATPWSLGNLAHYAPSVSIDFGGHIPPATFEGGEYIPPDPLEGREHIPPATVEGGERGTATAFTTEPPVPTTNGRVSVPASTPQPVAPASGDLGWEPIHGTQHEPVRATHHLQTPDSRLRTPDNTSTHHPLPTVLMAVWAIVAAGMLVTLLYRAIAYHRRVTRDLRPLDPALDVIVQEQAARLGLGTNFSVRVSPHLATPTVCMVRRSTVLLPEHLMNDIAPEQFANLIGHELAHIKRHDLPIGWAATLLLCFYWFHPAVWVATINLRREREMACDDEVLYASRPESKDYAATILRVAESFDGSMPAGSGFLGLFEVGEHLLQRIRSISDATRPRRAGAKSIFTVVAAAVLLIPMGIWTSQTSAESNDAIEREIQEHYAKADPEVIEFIRMTATRFGPEGLWFDADAFASLTPEERAEKVERVREALEGPNATKEFGAIAEAGALGDPSLLQGLSRIAWYMADGGQDNRSKWMAVAALGRIGNERAVPVLIPLVDHYNKNTRMWARASLVRLTGQNFGADKQAWAKWANAAGPETTIASGILELMSRQSEEKMAAQRESETATASTTERSPELPTLGQLPASAADIPGEVIFHGNYVHRSRGSQLQQPSAVIVKSVGNAREAVAICEFPAMESIYFASYNDPRFTHYLRRTARGDAPSAMIMDLDEGSVRVVHIGGEQDGQIEEYSIPAGAIFDPNTRPDPYVASFFLQEIYDNSEESEFTVYDWDNSGKGMASYTIKIENKGEETVVVPAGVFTATHIVQTQTSFGDTWFKKRPGHVTEYWVADSSIIIRVLRHREPYEVLLESVVVGADLLNPVEGDAARAAQEAHDAAQAATPQGQLEAAANAEIDAHYQTADAETKEYIRWTARTFGPVLWKPADAFASLSPEARELKVQELANLLDGEYGRHLCESLADAGAIQDPKLLPGLTKHATYHRDDANYDCRPKWMAVSALGRQDDISGVPALVPLVDHGNQNTRTWARASLARLTGQWFGEDKKAWAKWWNESGHEPKIDVSTLKPWMPLDERQAAPSESPQSPASTAPPQPPAEIEANLPVVGSPFRVPANTEAGNEWLHTGMIMPHGAVFELRATGSVLWDRKLPRVGPGGSGSTPAKSCSDPHEFPLPDAPCGALIGRIDRSGTPFLVGEGTRLIGGGGYLFLTINDRFGSFADNEGEFVVTATTSKSAHYSTQTAAEQPAQLQSHGAASEAIVPEEAAAIAAKQPGKLAFKAIYQHKSGDEILPGFEVVWGKRTDAREFTLTSYLPASNATYVAYVQPGVESFRRYEVHSHGLDGQPASEQIMELSTGSLTVQYRGGRKNGEVSTISVPMDSAFEPNSSPDPYAAHMALIGYGFPRQTRELDLFDWDNSFESMAVYGIRLDYKGQEEVTVPAGTFIAHHSAVTQLTSADTAFDKQAGDVTDYWWLDGGMVVRILRHRGPYELVLVGAETPVRLPGQVEKPSEAAVPAQESPTATEPKEQTATGSAHVRPPELVSVSPEIGATGVDPATTEIRITFDQDMNTEGYSWTGGGEYYPETTGKPRWVDARTCVLPVALKPARFYRVGVNAKSYNSFQSVHGVPATDRVLYFATEGLPQADMDKLMPPKVTALEPANGASVVSPSITELKITFDKAMGGGFAWCTIDDHFPETTGNAAWTDDHLTCTLPVALKPNTLYRIGLNIGRFNTFQSEAGVPMEPMVWEFTTGESDSPADGSPMKANKDNLSPTKVEGQAHAVLSGRISAKETAEAVVGAQVTLVPRTGAQKKNSDSHHG